VLNIDKILDNKIISLTRFMDGGAAIFPELAIKNQKVNAGKNVIIPFVKNSLRVEVTS